MPISGLLNMFSSLANNSFNASQAAINRRWQEQMYEKQYSDNVNLWKMQQEYNTPENQVARLKQAGINPYLALGNISTGSATSAPQSAQAGSGAQATGTPAHFAGLTESVLNLLKSKDERTLLKEQAKNIAADSLSKRIDSITQHQKNMADIIGLLRGSERDAASAALNRSLRQTEDELRGFKKQQYIDESQTSLLNTISQLAYLHYLPTDKRLQYSEIVSNIALNYANRNLSVEQAATESTKQLLNVAQERGIHISNKVAFNTMGYAIAEIRGRAKKANTPQNLFEWSDSAGEAYGKLRDKYLDKVNKYVFKPSKRLWKDTKRAFGLP